MAEVDISESEWCDRAILREVEIRNKFRLFPPPAGEEVSAYKAELADFPAKWQGLILSLLTSGIDLGAKMRAADRLKFIRETVFAGIGLLLLLLGVAIVEFSKPLSTEQSDVSCALIASGLASLLVFLPGFLKLQGALQPNDAFESVQFRAGGASSIFILTFLLLRFGLKI